MIFKLAIRNLKKKPWKTLATIFVIAFSVAILFSVFSYGDSVGDFVKTTENANSLGSDITISYRSDSPSKIANTEGLNILNDKIEKKVGVLSVYGLFSKSLNGTKSDSYVYFRGFDPNYFDGNEKLEMLVGNTSSILKNRENVIISEKMSKEWGLSFGDAFYLSTLNKSVKFYVSGIAKNSGILAKDSPFTVVGRDNALSEAYGSTFGNFYSDIYIFAKQGQNLDVLVDDIKNIEDYKKMNVAKSFDEIAIESKINGLNAPIVIVGSAVVALCIFAIAFMFASNEKEKREFVSKMKAVGATKNQLLAEFFVESIVVGIFGCLLGLGLAIGLLALLLQVVLGSVLTFHIIWWKLCVSILIGLIVTVLAGFIPLGLSQKRNMRENMREISARPKIWQVALFVISILLTIIFLVLQFVLSSKIYAVFALLSFVALFVSIIVAIPYILRFVALCSKKSKNVEFKVATYNLTRIQTSKKSSQILVMAMAVSMILFCAYNLTTSIFTSYMVDFKDMIFVSNVPSKDEVVDEIAGVDGINSAMPIIWKQGEIQFSDVKKSVSIIGGDKNDKYDVLSLVDFEFVTNKNVVETLLRQGKSADKNYVFVDYSYSLLFGVEEGDVVNLKIDGQIQPFFVGGILKHKLFTGNYVIVAREVLADAFQMPAFDTVLARATNVKNTTLKLQSQFVEKNYFAITALDMYGWDIQSLKDVFALIGVLGGIVLIMSVVSIVSNNVVARGGRSREREQLQIAGMSKNSMLKMEFFEHLLISVVAFVLSFGLSWLFTMSLVNSLLLFDIFIDYVFATATAFGTSFSLAVFYALMPFYMNYKKSYNLNDKGM